MFFDKKIKAMSFAELVIVLAIIGTVSAMTLPSLKKYSQQTELAEQTKKAYLNLEDAVDNAVLSSGPVRSWSFSSSGANAQVQFFEKYIAPNIRYTRVNASTAELLTADGMKYQVIECSDAGGCVVEVDVNNTKPPNINGKDVHRFVVDKDKEKIVPADDFGTSQLWKNNWKFTKELWNKTW